MHVEDCAPCQAVLEEITAGLATSLSLTVEPAVIAPDLIARLAALRINGRPGELGDDGRSADGTEPVAFDALGRLGRRSSG